MNLHCSAELCLAIRSVEFGPAIESNRQLGFRNFAGLGQAHSVNTGHQPWASHSRRGNLRARWHARWLHTHRPGHAIQPGAFAGWQFIDDMAGGIQNFQLQFSKKMTLALVVIDHGGIRWIIADKNGVAIGPAAGAYDPLLDGTG